VPVRDRSRRTCSAEMRGSRTLKRPRPRTSCSAPAGRRTWYRLRVGPRRLRYGSATAMTNRGRGRGTGGLGVRVRVGARHRIRALCLGLYCSS
jgi:hypothetical protein